MFLQHSLVFFVGSAIVAFLNYLYHPVLGRIMSIEHFGELQALISLYLLPMTMVSAVNLTAIHFVANNDTTGALPRLQGLTLLFMIFLGAILVLLAPMFAAAFHFSDGLSFFALAFALIVSVPLGFQRSYLQGQRDFFRTSLTNSIVAAGRLIFAVAFVALGWSTFGAMAGFAFALLAATLYTCSKTRQGLSFIFRFRLEDFFVPVLALVAIIFITFLWSADVVAIKYFFSDETAGLYGGVATVARIIFFATAPVSLVLLSYVKLSNTAPENNRAFYQALLLVCAIGGGALVLFWAFPSFFISLLVGERYEVFAHLLPKLSLVLFLISLLHVLFFYFLALRRRFLIGIALIGIAILAILVAFFHETPLHIINNFLYVSLGILAFGAYEKIREHYRPSI